MPVKDDNPKGDEDLQSAFSKYMKDAPFLIPTPRVLEKLVQEHKNK